MSFLKPVGPRIIIEQVQAEEKIGEIYLPTSAKEKPFIGRVVAVGVGTPEFPIEVNVGDKVLFSKFGGTAVKHEGKEYLIMMQEDVLAVISDAV